MSQKTLVILIIILGISSLIGLFVFWRCVEEHHDFITVALTFALVAITAIYVIYTKNLATVAQKQINLQLTQFKLENRPSVFLSGWGQFKKLDNMSTLQFSLENVGRLPAKFGTVEYIILIGDKQVRIDSEDFSKPSVIFPNQKNMHIDLPVPDVFFADIQKNRGFDFTFRMNYYSINDAHKKDEFSYYVKYSLRMKDSATSIDEYILLEIDAT